MASQLAASRMSGQAGPHGRPEMQGTVGRRLILLLQAVMVAALFLARESAAAGPPPDSASLQFVMGSALSPSGEEAVHP